ncbi:hypothetical protein [Bacteroides eggerthii]|uniref:hypothetical protein n=1 Tax=Bacteroides eggerthii TaxID=28111 RepID=UPI00189CAB3D|nr:hypothetical protein [Bacteroides eggerthii]
MDKVKGVNGNIIVGTINVDGVEMSKAVLSDAIWQGVVYGGRSDRQGHNERKAGLSAGAH